jgi:hypothetical protein
MPRAACANNHINRCVCFFFLVFFFLQNYCIFRVCVDWMLMITKIRNCRYIKHKNYENEASNDTNHFIVQLCFLLLWIRLYNKIQKLTNKQKKRYIKEKIYLPSAPISTTSPSAASSTSSVTSSSSSSSIAVETKNKTFVSKKRVVLKYSNRYVAVNHCYRSLLQAH